MVQKSLMLRSTRSKKISLLLGFFVMSLGIETLAPILYPRFSGPTNLIASILVFGYIFAALLYLERLGSAGKGFWRRRGVITVLVWIVLYGVGMIMVLASGGF